SPLLMHLDIVVAHSAAVRTGYSGWEPVHVVHARRHVNEEQDGLLIRALDHLDHARIASWFPVHMNETRASDATRLFVIAPRAARVELLLDREIPTAHARIDVPQDPHAPRDRGISGDARGDRARESDRGDEPRRSAEPRARGSAHDSTGPTSAAGRNVGL